MINVQLTVINVQRYNSTFNTQHSNLHCRAKKMFETLNKQVKFLTSQYIGTCKSVYTKGYALN